MYTIFRQHNYDIYIVKNQLKTSITRFLFQKQKNLNKTQTLNNLYTRMHITYYILLHNWMFLENTISWLSPVLNV